MANPLMQSSSQGVFYWTHGEDVARSYPIPFGTTAILFDTVDPVFYVKALDLQGNLVTFEINDYTKREPPAPPSYATTDDLGKLAAQLSDMKKMLEDLTAPAGR